MNASANKAAARKLSRAEREEERANIEPQRFALIFDPPTIVLEYRDKRKASLRHRKMQIPASCMQDIELAVKKLVRHNNVHLHRSVVSTDQVRRLVTKLLSEKPQEAPKATTKVDREKDLLRVFQACHGSDRGAIDSSLLKAFDVGKNGWSRQRNEGVRQNVGDGNITEAKFLEVYGIELRAESNEGFTSIVVHLLACAPQQPMMRSTIDSSSLKESVIEVDLGDSLGLGDDDFMDDLGLDDGLPGLGSGDSGGNKIGGNPFGGDPMGGGGDPFNTCPDLKKEDVMADKIDLNKADETVVAKAKELMDEDFHQKALRPGDEGFEYDKRIEFEVVQGAGDWDDESGSEEEELIEVEELEESLSPLGSPLSIGDGEDPYNFS